MRANLPRGTQVATDKGFIPIEQYRGERLIVLRDKAVATYESAYHIAKDTMDGWMVQLGGEGLRLIARPEQKIACASWIDGVSMWSKPVIEIEDSQSPIISLIAADKFEQAEMDITDDELALSALISVRLTEENVKSLRMEYCREPEAKLILELCDRLGFNAHSTPYNGAINVFIDKFSIHGNIFTSFPSDILSSLSKRQMSIVLDALGSCASDKRYHEEEVFVWTIDPWVVDVVMIMSILCGHKCHILRGDRKVKYFPKRYKGISPTMIKTHRTQKRSGRLFVTVGASRIVDYVGEVYSLYVPNGYIVIRQSRAISIIYAGKD